MFSFSVLTYPNDVSKISHMYVSASNQYTYIVDPAEHCQLLHRLPHHLPLRGGHLCSRLWDSVHQGGEDPGDLPSVIPIYLAFFLGRASFGVDYRLFYWEEGRRPETCSCGNWVKDAAERVWKCPDHQRRFQRRGNGEGWRWKPGGLRSRKRPVSKKFWVVLSVIHAWALFDKWMSEILRNKCTLRASWNAGVLIQTSSGGHIVECPIIMYILVYIEQNVLFWPRSDPKSPCPSRSSIGRRWMVGAV